MASIVTLLRRYHALPGVRPQRARAARGVPRRDAAADEERVEAALDERLRHVAPDVEAVGAVNGHRLARRQLGDHSSTRSGSRHVAPAIRSTWRDMWSRCRASTICTPLPLAICAASSLTESDGISVVDDGSSFSGG